MKKIIAIATALTVSVWMVGPGIAQGATAEELAAQIATLQTQLTALQAQLAALTGAAAGAPAACAGITFTRNLTVGSSGTDVKCLQALLNQAADTQVAATGSGSAGNETTYFGPLTKAAVVKLQVKYAADILTPLGLTAGTGYVGSATRTKLSALLAVAPVTPVTPVTPTEPGITTPGAEGTLVATLSSSVANNQEAYTKTTGNSVIAVELQAAGSDILVKRFDFNADKRLWLYIKNLIITDGTTSKTVAVTEANTSEITVGSSYTVIVSGLSFLVPKDTKKVLTVKVDGADELPSGTTSQAIVVTIGANAIRGIDGAGVDQYAPTSGLSTRTFTAKSGDTANLELSSHVDNPKARNVQVLSTAETTGVVLAKFNLKATNRNAILRTLRVDDISDASGTIKALELYDGDTLLSSTSSLGTATSSIENINLTIAKDTTKTLTLKATLYKAQGNYSTADASLGEVATTSVTVEANKGGSAGGAIEAEDATTFATATVSGATVAPGQVYYFTKLPSLALVSTSVASVSVSSGTAGTLLANNQADAKIKINITASGGDIYVASTTANDVTATTTIAGSSTITETIGSNAAATSGYENWIVYSGETKWFEIAGRLDLVEYTDNSEASAWTYMYLTNLKWASTDPSGSAATNNQTWGFDDLKTSSVYLAKFSN